MSTETISQQIAVGTWAVDPVHSSVGFAVTYNGVTTFRSRFGSYEATLTGGEAAALEGSVDVASIDINEDQLKGHLLSPDFFDAESYPRLKFVSSELSVDDDGEAKLRGTLEIRGQAHEVAAEGRFTKVDGADLAGNARVGLSFETSVDRRSFGLDWNADLPNGGQALEYEVAITVELAFVGQAA